jgi:glyoxylase-like metal-dependent hydrolase (beta-lactamase superfamily II)
MMFGSQTVELKTASGQPLRVHLVSTGGVTVKTKFRDARMKDLLAKIDLMLDQKFTDWLPIWVMIIEHPEGIFVIDTGENSHINDPDYFKAFGRMVRWFNTTQYKFKVERDEEIDRQLESLAIPNEKIKAVILTHLHLDHVDGLRHFPQIPIIVNKAEWQKPYGDLPALYPPWFKPELVELKESYDVFDKAYFITGARDIVLVETPGHTWHHCSLILKTAQCHIVFGADVCYTQQQLVDQKYAGANASHKLSVDTYSKLQVFCKNHHAVFIPSHEAAAAERLRNLKAVIIP